MASGRSARVWLVLAVTVVLPAGALVLFVLAARATDVPVEDLVRDPAATFDASPLVGIASNVGILLWAAATTVCLFTVTVLRMIGRHEPFHGFLLWAGGLTAVLLFDDLLLFHEEIAPEILGVGQRIVIPAYGAATLWGLWRYRHLIRATESLLLVMALGFFGLSLAVDVLHEQIEPLLGPGRILLEDGFKLLGIAAWLSYFTRTCLDLAAPAPVGSPPAAGADAAAHPPSEPTAARAGTDSSD